MLTCEREREQKLRAAVEGAAQAVLGARAAYQQGDAPAALADLYAPTTMPPNLVKAHRELDRAVDAAYLAQLPPGMTAKPQLGTDAQRVAFLFTLHQHPTSLFAPAEA